MVALLKTNASQSPKDSDFVNILVPCVGSSIGFAVTMGRIVPIPKGNFLNLESFGFKTHIIPGAILFFREKNSRILN